jgi:hypothetical protein
MNDRPANFPLSAKRLLRQTKWGDYLVAIFFVLLASASFRLSAVRSENPQTRSAQVMVNNRVAGEIDLHQPKIISVRGRLGEVALEVAAQRVRVRSSSCPNQFCVKQGFVSRPGQMLVCVPNHLAVLITGRRPNHLDAITY